MNTSTTPCISAFGWVPDFAKGQVRDLRLRWAFEEIGAPHRTELLDASQPRGDAYKTWQPFGQVPAYRDDAVELFESGAILLYLGQRDERLLPHDPKARWDATAWLFAGLNSVEPFIAQIVMLDVFYRGEDWVEQARPSARRLVESRLADLSRALEDRDWLAGRFSIADIVMVSVLRMLDHTDMLDAYPALAAYRQRGMERPAFVRALDAQLADFADEPLSAQQGA